jgi:hypothetical protein
MRKNRLIQGHWPHRKDKNIRIPYESSIPPRDWKYWLVVALLVILMGVLIYVLLKAA